MRWRIFVAIIAVLAVTAVAYGQPGECRKGAGGRGTRIMEHIDQFADEIGLSAKQLDAIKEIRTTMGKRLIDLRAEVEKAEIDLRSLTDDPNAKSSDIESAYRKVSAARQDMELGRVQMMLQIRDVLSPNQRAQVRELVKEKMKEHRRKMKGQGKCHKGGFEGGGNGIKMMPPPMPSSGIE